MPKVLELACRNDDCRLDMFTVHYAPNADRSEGFHCPGCGGRESLEPLDSNI